MPVGTIVTWVVGGAVVRDTAVSTQDPKTDKAARNVNRSKLQPRAAIPVVILERPHARHVTNWQEQACFRINLSEAARTTEVLDPVITYTSD